MSALTMTPKETKNVQEILDITIAASKEGITRRDAFKLLVNARNIMRGWDVEKPKEEQDCRLEYHSAQNALKVWWSYCRTGKGDIFHAEALWNVAVLLDGMEAPEPGTEVEAAPAPAKKKATKKKAKAKKEPAPKPKPEQTPAMIEALRRIQGVK